MKTNLNLIAVGVFLVAGSAGLGQPGITNQPQSQAVAPGEHAVFTVGASSTEPLAYQWQRNFGAGFSGFADCTNATLALSDVQIWDATDYRVIVSNYSDARTSSVAHLYAMEPTADQQRGAR